MFPNIFYRQPYGQSNSMNKTGRYFEEKSILNLFNFLNFSSFSTPSRIFNTVLFFQFNDVSNLSHCVSSPSLSFPTKDIDSQNKHFPTKIRTRRDNEEEKMVLLNQTNEKKEKKKVLFNSNEKKERQPKINNASGKRRRYRALRCFIVLLQGVEQYTKWIQSSCNKKGSKLTTIRVFRTEHTSRMNTVTNTVSVQVC